MNLDIASQIEFGDAEGLRAFALTHRFVHLQTALVFATTNNIVIPSGGLWGQAYEDAWITQMLASIEGENIGIPPPIADWLRQHAQLHQDEYTGLQIGDAPDLSNVDFGKPSQFYEWMDAHRLIHETVQNILGIS